MGSVRSTSLLLRLSNSSLELSHEGVIKKYISPLAARHSLQHLALEFQRIYLGHLSSHSTSDVADMSTHESCPPTPEYSSEPSRALKETSTFSAADEFGSLVLGHSGYIQENPVLFPKFMELPPEI